jgi:hypothetical protein
MNRPTLEVADIIRTAGNSFIECNRDHLAWPHLKVLRAIRDCRTAALGGHIDRCARCDYQAISYNSCRNRHCPKCQVRARENWVAKQAADLLPVPYFHVVFTLPHELSAVALQNKRAVYNLLFHAAAQTLLEVATDPMHLGAEIGFLAVLHTWGQNLQHHPHIHCIIPAGGLSPDHSRWIRSPPGFFLPVRVLSAVFRGKFSDGLKRLFRRGKLSFHGPLSTLHEPKRFHAFLRQLWCKQWVVYAKKPFRSAEYVLQYLGRYTHRVAISNHRLVAFEDGNVTFLWRDYAHGNKKRMMTLTADEFLRRFLLHVLPRGLTRIRHFGFLANRRHGELMRLCRRLLEQSPPPSQSSSEPDDHVWTCPQCAGPMTLKRKLTAAQFLITGYASLVSFADSS